jgi:glycosyltransferase involved in cell wall biosynthesis
MGTGRDREKLQGLISELGLEGNVFLLGHVDGASQYMKAFDIFMLASLSEGLAYVLIEAGAASLPVVATAVGGIPEVIDDMGSGILVQPRNARELSHALLFMVEHPDDRKKYGAALKEKVSQKFSLEEMAAKTADVYTDTHPGQQK